MALEGISTSTLAGWVSLVGVGVAYGYYMTRAKGTATAPARRHQSHHAEPRKEKNAKNRRREAFVSDAHDSTGAEKVTGADTKSKASKPAGDSSDDEADNKEFARQLSTAREGTKFNTKSSGEKSRQKSLKQSQAAKADFDSFDEKLSAPSSTAGVDADDDQSPTLSPQVTAADAGDVSDMLEPAPAGPSILRIVDTDKVKQAPPKKAKEAEVAETKKQRQNRKKREAEKELREEAEKERKKMEEAQRRTARIARGEAAKDGSQFMARVNGANKASAWTAGPPNGGSSSSNSGSQPGPDGFVDTQPLDTFDPTAAPANGQGQSLADSWISELPSEEEQLKKLQEETEEWSTVVTKSQKRGAKKYASSEKSDATDPANVVAAAAAPPPAASRTAPGPAPQQKPVNGKGARTLQSFGSFSALSTNEEEKETEWEL